MTRHLAKELTFMLRYGAVSATYEVTPLEREALAVLGFPPDWEPARLPAFSRLPAGTTPPTVR